MRRNGLFALAVVLLGGPLSKEEIDDAA